MQVLWVRGFTNNYNITPGDFVNGCYIGHTNKRIFKIEYNKVHSVLFENIVDVAHEEGVFFSWYV